MTWFAPMDIHYSHGQLEYVLKFKILEIKRVDANMKNTSKTRQVFFLYFGGTNTIFADYTTSTLYLFEVHMQTILTYYPSCPDDYEPNGYKAHTIQVDKLDRYPD